MPNKQCPECKRTASLTQFQWNMGSELPKDCPWCNKPIEKKEEKTKNTSPKNPKTTTILGFQKVHKLRKKLASG